MSKIYIVDNSVLIKALREREEDHELALDVLSKRFNGNIEIILPSLWLYEAGNAILNVKPAWNDEEKITALKSLQSLKFKELNVLNTEKVFELCSKYAVTFYDAYYHALAIQEGATLITADIKYFIKAKKAGHIIRLEDFK